MRPLLHRLSIRQKLLGAFAVDLALLVMLGSFSWVQMGAVRDEADEVTRQTLPALRNMDRTQAWISTYRRLQLELVLYPNAADRRRLAGQMDALESDMQIALREQDRFVGDDAERVAFDELDAAWTDYVEHTRYRFLPALRRSALGTAQPSLSRLNPLYDRLENAAARLERLKTEAAADAMTRLQETHRMSRRVIVADTAFALIVSAVVGLMLATTLAHRIQLLTSATRRVAGGDLDWRVSPGLAASKDELGHLAENFERMVSHLRDQRRSLESRHQELRHSLEAQRRLTEDLVRREQSEKEAFRARAEAEARDSAKSLFLATMSHELRTPLNAVLGFVQIMTLEAEARGEERALSDLRRISVAGKHLATLINNLLDFSKIEQGEMEIEIVHCSARELTEETSQLVEPLCQKGRNVLEVQIEGDIGHLKSDVGKIRQVLFNLLSNAAKFTESGHIRMTLERFRHDDGSDWLRWRVSDTGIGIHPDHLDLIFEPFRQADAGIGRRFGGTGLGLVISRRLTRLLGGNLAVESRLGEGSTFTVSLPARCPDMESGPDMKPPSEDASALPIQATG